MAVYAANTDKLGVYVHDLRSGRDWDAQGGYSSQSASMAKVMIAALALRRTRSDGHALEFDRMTDVSNALINSDNDSADRLWRYVGGDIADTGPENLSRAADAYQRLANELSMTETRRDTKRPDWSWTWTTPQDQVTLLDQLLGGTSALVDADRLYLLDVMRKTNPSQIWGVGTKRSEHVAVQMKNGWVQFASSDGLWAVNSMGHVSGEGRDYLAAIMCRVPTFELGKALVDAIGGDLFRVLGAGPL
jgi:beta-lactamase class A